MRTLPFTPRRLQANGITHSVVVEGDGPLCILVHGWPELWLSWRHQIAPLVEAGYRVAVPDVRGYGDSDAPAAVEDYNMRCMAGDVVGLIDALGEEQAVLIGHDWGAPIVWHTALLHPDRVRAVAGLSVPYIGRPPQPPLELLAAIYQQRFFYILYFQQPGVAEAELEADVRDSLRKIFFANSGDVTAEVRRAVRARTPASGYLDGMSAPDEFPAWLAEEELDAYARAFERTGFRGSLNRYRNMDHDWHDLPELTGRTISQPALFVAGQHDSVLRYVPGVDVLALMDAFFEDLRAKTIISGAGHWVQQERPEAVNRVLVQFVTSLR